MHAFTYRFVQCSNYTWGSSAYLTDQVIISRDSPCTAVMPGTKVSADCDPAHAYNPANGKFLFYFSITYYKFI